MNDSTLIPVFSGTLGNSVVQLCDARTLHTFMQVRRDFSNWIKGRIRKFGFIAGEDFIAISRSPELASGNLDSSNQVNQKQVFAKSGENLGGRPGTDYHLTLDMAKELAMVENNEQGRAARRYFIECERRALTAATVGNPAIDYARISPAQAQDLKQIVSAIADAKIQTRPETWARFQNKFKVNSYLQLPATRHFEARKYLIAKLPAGYAGEWLADEPDLEPVDLLNGHTVKNMRDVARDYLCAHSRAVKEGKNYITMDYTAPKALESVFVHALTSQRLFSWFDSASGKMQSKLIPADSVIFSPEQGSFEGLVESTSLERLPELMEAVNKRVANHPGVLRARMSQGNLGLER